MKNIRTTRSGEDCPADLKQDIKKYFPFLSDSSAVWIDVNSLVAPQPPPIVHHTPPFYQPNSADPYYANSASQGFVEHPFYPPQFAQQPPPTFLTYPPQHGNYEDFMDDYHARTFNPPPFVPALNDTEAVMWAPWQNPLNKSYRARNRLLKGSRLSGGRHARPARETGTPQ